VAGTANASAAPTPPAPRPGLPYPNGIAIDTSGNLYVADTQNSTIRMITPAGVVSRWPGCRQLRQHQWHGAAAGSATPTGVAVDSTGNAYVADS